MSQQAYEEIETVYTYTTEEAIEDGTVIDVGNGVSVNLPDDDSVPDLANIDGMDAYLKAFGKILGKKAIHALNPLHVPNRDPVFDFSEMMREPFPCQADVITATVKMMDHRGSGFIVGEMGVGKTIIGFAACHYHAMRSRRAGGKGGNYRALVVCPDHLVGKWIREIKETIPDVTTYRFGPQGTDMVEDDGKRKKRRKAGAPKVQSFTRKQLHDTLALMDQSADTEFEMPKRWTTPKGAEWYVIGRNQAKWMSDWIGIADEEIDYDDQSGMALGTSKVVQIGRRPDRTPVTKILHTSAVCPQIQTNHVSSSKVVSVDRVVALDDDGRPRRDPETGKEVMKTITAKAYYCPKCGSTIRNDKHAIEGKNGLSAESKNATQKTCEATIMVAKHDPENPHRGYDSITISTWRDNRGKFSLQDRYGDKKEGTEVNFLGRKWEIQKCGEPLFNYVSQPYRWAPAWVIQRKLKRFFSYLLIDEVHEHKSETSARSMSVSKLMAGCPHILALTGTIIGGYANHLFPLMMRITPDTLKEEGYSWGKDGPFTEVYGRIDTVIRTTEEVSSKSERGKVKSMRRAKSGKSTTKTYVRPGIMPALFGNHMIGTSIFLTLDELSDELPDLFEYIGGDAPTAPEPTGNASKDALYADHHARDMNGYFDVACDMESDQKAEYDRIARIMEFVNSDLLKRGSMKFLGAMLWTLMDYPDRPYGWDHAPEVKKAYAQALEALVEAGDIAGAAKMTLPYTIGFWDKPGIRDISNFVGVVTPKSLSEDVIYPKEQTLIDICKKQKKDGLQTWVYVNMTRKRDIQPRLKMLLEREGMRVGILRSSDVLPIDREAWITAHGREYDVMLSHPELVSTGLDLFSKVPGGHNYSTIVFYQTGYNLFTMRQAARRAWRISQPNDCRIYYLHYKEAMQHKAMSLMSKKMAAAQALEGEFSADGLAAMAGDDNLQMSLAKDLSERIDGADVQRNWAKIKSGPKKRNPGATMPIQGDAMVSAGKQIPASNLDNLPIEVQMVAETIIEGSKKPPIYEAMAEFPGLAARLAQLDAGFDEYASNDYVPEPEDTEPEPEYSEPDPEADVEEITPGLVECVAGIGLDDLPSIKKMIEVGEEIMFQQEHASDADHEPEDDHEPEPEDTILPFTPAEETAIMAELVEPEMDFFGNPIEEEDEDEDDECEDEDDEEEDEDEEADDAEEEGDEEEGFFDDESAETSRIQAMLTPEVMEKMLANMRANGTII